MQKTFDLKPLRALAGLHADTFPFGVISRALSTKQLEELTFGTTNGTYAVTINGTEVANHVATGLTATQIRDAIKADIDASAAPVITTPSGADKLLIEKDDFGDAFTISIPVIVGYSKTQLRAQGAAAPFGVGVVRDERAPISGRQCRLPRLATDVTSGGFLGVLMNNTAKSPTNGWPGGTLPDILRMGHIHVVIEGTGNEGQPLFMRFAAGAGGTQPGAFRADADGGTAVAVPGMRAIESWAASGVVMAEVFPQT